MVEHHPPEFLLAAFVAGKLDLGQHVAIATHLAGCAHCRGFARSLEQVAGTLLSDLAPSELSDESWAKVVSRLDEPAPAGAVAAPARENREAELARLPAFVRHYRFGEWKWIAPSVHLRPIALPVASESRVFLLRSGPGAKMLQHTHSGLEMTCILSGAFSQDGSHFGPGDFDWGDEAADHRPIVDAEQECVCLIAIDGQLRLKGLVGRLLQPLIRI